MDPDELEPGYPLRWSSSPPTTGFIAQEVTSLTTAPNLGLTDQQLAAINASITSTINGTGKITLPPGSEHWSTQNIVPAYPMNFTEHVIQGELSYADYIVAQEIIEDNLQTPDMIKERLMHDLAKKLMDNKMIEFTRTQNIASGTYHFRARIYAVPDTKVRILREAGMLAKPPTT